VLVGKAPGLFDNRAKDMRRHRAHSGDALKRAGPLHHRIIANS
jgi:hypothetical protein